MKKLNMSGRTKSIIALSIVLVLTLLCGILGVNGMNLDSRGLYKLLPWLPTTDVENWPKPLALGLDLRGGVYVEYQAAQPESTDGNFEELLNGTIAVIQNRLTDKGYPESTVVKLGTDGIRVEIPDVTDPNAILDLIGSPAKLEFLDPDGNVFMEGKHVKTAVAEKDASTMQPIISFKLTSEGAKIFEEMTSKSLHKTLVIMLDGVQLMAPTVEATIAGGSGVITGLGSEENAKNIALKIQSGALPLEIKQQKVDTISATLGVDALSTSVLAAIIGLCLVMAVMLIRYRLCGLVADWALVIYIILLFFLLAIVPGIQLTLPGIAGIVLGIGMAVDANVIIFERFKEELRAGRPIKAAVRTGFKNAMSAILDANITTLIAAIVLLFFGTGSIQGFAKTLLLGVITSMFTAVLVTRFLMKNMANLGLKNVSLFASVKPAKKEEA